MKFIIALMLAFTMFVGANAFAVDEDKGQKQSPVIEEKDQVKDQEQGKEEVQLPVEEVQEQEMPEADIKQQEQAEIDQETGEVMINHPRRWSCVAMNRFLGHRRFLGIDHHQWQARTKALHHCWRIARHHRHACRIVHCRRFHH